jgi:hypothetical protein
MLKKTNHIQNLNLNPMLVRMHDLCHFVTFTTALLFSHDWCHFMWHTMTETWTEASGVLGAKENVRGRKWEKDKENYVQRTEKFVLFTKYMTCQMNNNGIMKPCGMHGRDEKYIQMLLHKAMCRWDDNIKIHVRKISCIQLALDMLKCQTEQRWTFGPALQFTV